MESPFQKFCSLIQSLDPNDDSIVIDRNLRYLASDINEVIEGDESMLRSVVSMNQVLQIRHCCLSQTKVICNDFWYISLAFGL